MSEEVPEPAPPRPPPRGTRHFAIKEDDLAELERILPQWADRICFSGALDNATKVQIRRVQSVVQNIRWNYGPPQCVEPVPDDELGPAP